MPKAVVGSDYRSAELGLPDLVSTSLPSGNPRMMERSSAYVVVQEHARALGAVCLTYFSIPQLRLLPQDVMIMLREAVGLVADVL